MHQGAPTSRQPDGPVYLTAAGRRRLEERVARYSAQIAAWRSGEGDDLAVDYRGDEAERLEEAYDVTEVQVLLAAAQAALDRAVPLPEGPDDGVVRLGSTVTVVSVWVVTNSDSLSSSWPMLDVCTNSSWVRSMRLSSTSW